MRFVPGGAAWWAAGAVVVLSACTGPAEAIVTETPLPVVSVSATPSPSPTESVSPEALAPLTDAELLELLPADAVIPDLWGAQVTAVFFLEQYGPMFQTGDTRVWEALSAEGCEYCENALVAAIELQDGGWAASGGDLVPDVETIVGRLDDDNAAHVLVGAEFTAATVTSSDGAVADETTAGSFDFGFELELQGGIWRVVNAASEAQQ